MPTKKLGISAKGVYLYAIPKFDTDSKTRQTWVGPFMSADDQMALSAFAEIAKSEPSLQRTYLYCIGWYNLETGKITPFEHRLVKAVTSKKTRKAVKNENDCEK